MAKSMNTGGSMKISFGSKKGGKAKKTLNKHEAKKVYRGQGR